MELEALSELDGWRLSDSLSVANAATLISGNLPSERQINPNGDYWFLNDNNDQMKNSFFAAFHSLRNAIRKNKLAADIRFSGRGTQYEQCPTEELTITELPNEEKISYELLLARTDSSTEGFESPTGGETKLNFSIEDLKHGGNFYFWKDPNWDETTVEVESLKQWLGSKGIYPPFFFPKTPIKGFMSKGHERYSSKLAACVAAWEAVRAPTANASVKKTVKDWLRSNAAQYGVGEDGIVSENAAEELAKIVNWNPSGGATPTHNPVVEAASQEETPIENYKYSHSEHPEDDS